MQAEQQEQVEPRGVAHLEVDLAAIVYDHSVNISLLHVMQMEFVPESRAS